MLRNHIKDMAGSTTRSPSAPKTLLLLHLADILIQNKLLFISFFLQQLGRPRIQAHNLPNSSPTS